MVKDGDPSGASSPSQLTNVNGALCFAADDGTHGAEVWWSDGTRAGTVMIGDIVTCHGGSDPYGLTNAKGTLFFYANDRVHGYEL